MTLLQLIYLVGWWVTLCDIAFRDITVGRRAAYHVGVAISCAMWPAVLLINIVNRLASLCAEANSDDR
jgi:hypothetical protein